VTNPAGIGEELRAQLAEHLRPEQVVELTLDVIAWSKQKVLVALDLDAPLDPDRPTQLDFDREGRAVVGGERYVSAADRPI